MERKQPLARWMHGGRGLVRQEVMMARGKSTIERQRGLQDRASEREAQKSSSGMEEKKVMQAGARAYPAPPFPIQHQPKPGEEAKLVPEPMFEAPYYRGSGKLENRIAVITGGDSGIGRAVAVLFAREGANVAICHLGEDRDATRTKRAVEAEGRECITVTGNVSDREFCFEAISQVTRFFGDEIDILVNNAAFQLHANQFEDISAEQFDMTVKTNLYGYFFMTQAAAPKMPGGGSIINTGSITGVQGSGHLVDYALTKGGIHAFTKSLAIQLAPRGIRVNAVAPGPVWTPLNPADKDGGDVAQFGSKTMMKRPAQPEEIAPAYVFLASPHCSSYMTGEIIVISGGPSGG